MAVVTQHVLATPEEIFDVLSDGWRYPSWVVGASHVRAVEPDFPAAGTRIHHSSGIWPVLLKDETRVERCEPPNRLVLLARGRPWGEARVDLSLTAEDGGTLVPPAPATRTPPARSPRGPSRAPSARARS